MTEKNNDEWDNFVALATRLMVVPKYELNEELHKVDDGAED